MTAAAGDRIATAAAAGAGATVSAPGKLFLAGEYAVLEGGTAVVAAVSRRATARFVPGGAPASPLVEEAVRLARAWAAASRDGDDDGAPLPAGSVDVDTSAFYAGGRKLGLGSSAAVAVVAAAAVVDAAGIELGARRGAIRQLALRAHRAFQGGAGSGADVAACARGGVLAVSPSPDDEHDLSIESLPEPPAALVVFSTGTAASTVDLIRAVAALKQRDRRQHGALIGALAEAASFFRKAILGGNTDRLLEAARDAHEAMDALGRAAGVEIVTPALAGAGRLAVELGGAAKPSGAGGGDVGIALFRDQATAQIFRSRIPELGLSVLDIRIDSTGVMRRDDGAAAEREHVAGQA